MHFLIFHVIPIKCLTSYLLCSRIRNRLGILEFDGYGSDFNDATLDRVAASPRLRFQRDARPVATSFTAPISTTRRSTASRLLLRLRSRRRDSRTRRSFFYGSDFDDATSARGIFYGSDFDDAMLDRVAASFTAPSSMTRRSTASRLLLRIQVWRRYARPRRLLLLRFRR